VALKLIAKMYRLERQWDEAGKKDPAVRSKLRKEGFDRTLKWLMQIAVDLRKRARPQSLLGRACDYLLGHWDPLTAHLNRGETRLDNNLVENAIRPSAIGKKNRLFIGHPDAGQRHGKDPYVYLRDVLTRLPALTNRYDLDALTPVNWKSE
jgi:hypothetical protein